MLNFLANLFAQKPKSDSAHERTTSTPLTVSPPPPAERKSKAYRSTNPGRKTPSRSPTWDQPGRLPVSWVTQRSDLEDLAERLQMEAVIALDVETRIPDQKLALVQVATPEQIYLIDPLELYDLSPLAPIFSSTSIQKVIHYASFEKRILGKEGFEINGIVDTHKISKRYRGGSGKGRHTLQTVCERELSATIDKTCQTSNWMRRPLSRSQMHYAAMDVEVLIDLYFHFEELGALQN